MVSEKPWRAESLILLAAGLLLSMSMGALLAQALPRLWPAVEDMDPMFLRFIVGTMSIQGAALVLIDQFLRRHNVSWREILVRREGSAIKVLGIGLGAGLLVVPLTLLLLNYVSLELVKLVDLAPEKQTAITVIERTVEPSKRIWFALAAIVLAPVVEEVLFRGIMYPYLKQRTNPRLAVFATSVVFAAIHVNIMIFIPLIFLGYVLTWLYERTDSLLTPIVTHAVFNAANFFMLVYQDELTKYAK